MLAEKEDWIPRKFAPFKWINQEAGASTSRQEPPNPENREAKRSDEANMEISSSYSDSSSPFDKPTVNCSSPKKELQAPLLHSEEQALIQRKSTDTPEHYTRSRQHTEEQNRISEEDDAKPRRSGTRAKMISLSKKMSEKFEEKRRNIEEKGRNIVEKMKGQ